MHSARTAASPDDGSTWPANAPEFPSYGPPYQSEDLESISAEEALAISDAIRSELGLGEAESLHLIIL